LTTLLGPARICIELFPQGSPGFRQRSSISWQCIPDRQQTCLAVIENQAIRLRHFGAHGVTAEDHPWIKNGELGNGSVKLSTLNAEVSPAFCAREFEPGLDLLPKFFR
jgi:hypothetical protein